MIPRENGSHVRQAPKNAEELESMIVAELREHPECESAAIAIIGPKGSGWEFNERPKGNVRKEWGSPRLVHAASGTARVHHRE